jgi:hypothetical protein
MEPAGLDFGNSAATAEAVVVHSDPVVYSALIFAVVAYVGLAAGTGFVMSRRAAGVAPAWTLDKAPASLRVLAVMTVIGLGLAQGTGGADAYYQTQVVNESALAYFQYLSFERLIGISHAHLFGFAVSFGAQAFLLSFTRLDERLKAYAISFGLWAGIADVGSWWAVRSFDPRLHTLSFVTGTAGGLFVLLVTFAVVRSALRKSS